MYNFTLLDNELEQRAEKREQRRISFANNRI